MPTYPAATALMKASTRAFIAEDPSVIALVPGKGTKVEKPSGGYDFEDASPRDEQTFRIIDIVGDQTQAEGLNSRKFSYVLVGMPDSVAEVGDWWNDGINCYAITSIDRRCGYVFRASAESFSQEPMDV